MMVRITPALVSAGIFLALLSAASGQAPIVENPARPSSPDAGRIVKLEEVWRISDEGKEFFFDRPGAYQIGADGSLFVIDRDQILKFSPDGKFLKNILRLGQGPGEVTPQRGGTMPQVFVRGSGLYIRDRGAGRCWRTDLDGVFQEDLSVPKSSLIIDVGVVDDGLLYWTMEFPQRRPPVDAGVLNESGKFVDLPETLTLATWEPGKHKELFSITNKTFISPRMTVPDRMMSALGAARKRLYFVLGPEYLIQELDLASGTVIRKFRRPYQRVPAPARKPLEGPAAQQIEEDRRKGWFPPDPEFLMDIWGLRAVGDRLWVSTSTRDPEKGTLIDVFDRDGRYVDCFWTGKSWGPVYDGFVYCSEKGPDDTVSVVKYRIVK